MPDLLLDADLLLNGEHQRHLDCELVVNVDTLMTEGVQEWYLYVELRWPRLDVDQWTLYMTSIFSSTVSAGAASTASTDAS